MEELMVYAQREAETRERVLYALEVITSALTGLTTAQFIRDLLNLDPAQSALTALGVTAATILIVHMVVPRLRTRKTYVRADLTGHAFPQAKPRVDPAKLLEALNKEGYTVEYVDMSGDLHRISVETGGDMRHIIYIDPATKTAETIEAEYHTCPQKYPDKLREAIEKTRNIAQIITHAAET